MKILAIETTGQTCGVCIVSTEPQAPFQLMAIHELYREHVHDAQLAVLVETALTSAEMSISDVDVVAVSGGPGSFTGTRIGVSLAKGLCYTNAPRLVVVDTMHAMAEAAKEVAVAADRETVHIVIPSHRDLVYTTAYRVQHDAALMQRLVEITLAPINDVRSSIGADMVCGPGASLVSDSPISGLTRLSSRFVALRAVREIRHDTVVFADPLTAEPLYRQEFVGRS